MDNMPENNKDHYRSVLIAPKQIDIHRISVGFPWKSDAICFNFNMPSELCLWQDVETISDKNDIVTLVIDGGTMDYSFIADMPRLRQLYIYNSPELSNLSFVEELPELDQILINESHISTLSCLMQIAVFSGQQGHIKRPNRDMTRPANSYAAKGSLHE